MSCCFDIWVVNNIGLLLHSDWCISRQLWWGHQIPAYQVELPNSTDKEKVCLSVHSFHWWNEEYWDPMLIHAVF